MPFTDAAGTRLPLPTVGRTLGDAGFLQRMDHLCSPKGYILIGFLHHRQEVL